MKKIYVVLLSILAFVVLAAVSAGAYLKWGLPDVGDAPELKVEITPERVERGKYLAHSVAVCMDCHSTRDWTIFAGPLTGELGAGGEKFGREMGFPGEIYSPNITPFALSKWTDGEVFRAITTGVNRDGKALFPVMPYHHYGQMDKEDVYSIIAYLRSLKSVERASKERELDFPVSLLVNTMPKGAQFKQKPDESDQVAYGAYLVNVAGCVDCHSQVDKGAVIPGTEFGGGMEFKQPGGVIRSLNITPHPETGIGRWTKELFVKRFKHFADSTQAPIHLGPEDINSPMPWYMYGGMKESDLEAIFAYLQSLKPVDHAVQRFEKNK